MNQDERDKRLNQLEEDLRHTEHDVHDINLTLARITVVLENLADVRETLQEIKDKVRDHERNWGIVKWVIGPVSGIGLIGLALQLFGVI